MSGVIDARSDFQLRRVQAAYGRGCPVCGKHKRSGVNLARHLYACPGALEAFNRACAEPGATAPNFTAEDVGGLEASAARLAKGAKLMRQRGGSDG